MPGQGSAGGRFHRTAPTVFQMVTLNASRMSPVKCVNRPGVALGRSVPQLAAGSSAGAASAGPVSLASDSALK